MAAIHHVNKRDEVGGAEHVRLTEDQLEAALASSDDEKDAMDLNGDGVVDNAEVRQSLRCVQFATPPASSRCPCRYLPSRPASMNATAGQRVCSSSAASAAHAR
jgi:hypothetical protein